MSPVDFYTFFYTAGRYRLVRSDTDRYVECAKAQPSDTRWDRTGPGEKPDIRLITRRSQVQILPPPPTTLRFQGKPGRKVRLLPCSGRLLPGLLPARTARPGRRRFGDEVGEDRRGVGLHAGQDVLVAVDGEAGPGVTESFSDHLHVRLFLERLQDPDWLEPLRAAELIKLPEPQSPWAVAALTGPNRLLPDERLVELLGQLLNDVQALDRADRPAPSFEIMRNAAWLGPVGHRVVVAVLRQYPTEEWAHMMAMSAASGLDDSDPLHMAAADAVIGNESRHEGGYRTKQVLAHLVGGVTPTNVRERFELLAHKCRRLASSERAKYVVTDVTALTVDGWDDDEPLVLVANALARLVATARDMGVPNSWMLELVSRIPGEWGERLECQVLAGANEIGRNDKVAHLVRRLRSETATGDDRLLLDGLTPFSSEEILELRDALGQPAPPPPSSDRGPLGVNWARAWRWSMILPSGVLVGWDEAIAAVAAIHGQPDPTALDRPMRNAVFSHGFSPYPPEDLAAIEPLAAAELAAAWRPSAGDAWGVSARELARSIESVVKDDPVAWIDSPAEIVRVLREPVYINHYLRGLKASVAKLPPSTGTAVLRAVALIRAERWPPTTLGRDDYDYESDWTGVDSAVVELIDALADRDADLDDHLDHCWSLAGKAASDLPEDLGSVESYADAARHDDPLSRALRSSAGCDGVE